MERKISEDVQSNGLLAPPRGEGTNYNYSSGKMVYSTLGVATFVLHLL